MRNNIFRNILKEIATDAEFDVLERELDDMFSRYNVDIAFTHHFKDRVRERGVTEEDVIELVHKVIDKHGKRVANLPKGRTVVLSDLTRLVDIAAGSNSSRSNDLKRIVFITAYKRLKPTESEFRTNATSPVLAVNEKFIKK